MPNTAETLTQVTASSGSNPSATAVFNITTSPALAVTVENLFNLVELNAQKIQDQIIEVTLTSNDQDWPSAAQYRIWQKDDLMKIQDLSTSETEVRPQLSIGTTYTADVNIINYDFQANKYIVKTKDPAQTEDKPYTLIYIDCTKGVITKIEAYYETEGLTTLFVTEMSDFIQVAEADNAWVYNTKMEKIYEGGELLSVTTIIVTARQVNVGLTEADF